jgi:hypothetical protein
MRILLVPLLLALAAISTARADPTPPWQWDTSTPDLFPRADLSVVHGGATYTLALQERKAGKYELELGNGSWSVTIGSDHDGELTGAALAVDDARVYVATYGRITTGCTLAAYRASDGKLAWSVELTGAGPIAHSKYSNRVQLALIDGKPTVFGSESAARYVEVREPATGKLVGNTQLPWERAERPVAEPLFVEVDHMLANHETYRVDVDDFLARHGLMKGADRASRADAFRAAVRALDGTRLQHGKFKLSLALEDDGKHLAVAAKRQ